MKRFLAATLLLTIGFFAQGDEWHRLCFRQYPHAFDMHLEVIRTPSLTHPGTYLLKVRSVTSEPTTARLEWFLPRGIQSVPATTVYVPASGELVVPVSVAVQAPGVYDVVAALTPLEKRARTETTARYLRVTEASSFDSETPLPWDPAKLAPLPAQVQRAPMVAVPAGMTRFFGRLTYQDETTRAFLPIRGAIVQLAERVIRRGVAIENIQQSVTADADGAFAFTDVPTNNEDGSPKNYRVNILIRHPAFHIVDARGAIYKRTTEWTPAVSATALEMNIAWDIASGRSNIGVIFNALQDAYDFFKRTVGFERKFIEVEYPSFDNATYYSVKARGGFVSDELIRIGTSESGHRPAIFHEYGHAIMTGAYGDRFDAIPFGEPREGGHFLYTVSDPQFAISEGWAEFCEALVDDDAFNVRAYRNADLPNIETNEWWTGAIEGGGKNRSGEIVEGAVASILWDLSDGPQSRDTEPAKDDDGITNEFARVWEIFVSERPKTVIIFRDEWIRRGYPQKDAMSAIFAKNGIGKTPVKGDINGDDVVDILDLVLVAQRFGESGPFPGVNPDVTGNGIVDIFDLVTVASNFGARALAAPSLAMSGVSVQPDPSGRSFHLEGVDAVVGARFLFAVEEGNSTETPKVSVASEPNATWQSCEKGELLVAALRVPLREPRFELATYARPARIRLVEGEVVTPDGERFSVAPTAWLVIPFDSPSLRRLTVGANYPNPFNPDTWIPFQLSAPANVEVRLFDARGQMVRRWSLGNLPAGDYGTREKALHWDGKNEAGEPVASGPYWVVFETEEERATRRLLLAK